MSFEMLKGESLYVILKTKLNIKLLPDSLFESLLFIISFVILTTIGI